MSVETARCIVVLFYAYAVAGIVFATWFVLRGVNGLDEVARSGTPGFRALILPGSAALWPVLLWKMRARARTQRAIE